MESVHIIEVLLLGVRSIGYLHEYLSFELQISDKIYNFVSQDDFGTFADNFELILEILAEKFLF